MELLWKKAQKYSKDSLYRNSFYLMANTLQLAAFGFFYWILNARFYTSSQVGLATTLVSLCTLLSSLSFIGINTSITRYLSGTKRKNDIINTGADLTALSTVLVTFIFIIGIPLFSPKLALLQNPVIGGGFLLFMVIYIWNLLLESIFIGYRSAKYTLIKNLILSMTKLALPVFLVALGALGIFLSFSIANIASLFIGVYFLMKHFSYKPNFCLNRTIIKKISGFSFGNYVANFIVSFPSLALPVIISNAMNYQSAAYFYIDMMIANLLYIIPFAASQSLFAEGSHNKEQLPSLLNKTFKIASLLMIPAIILTVLFGNAILLVFGKSYSHEGITLLRYLALSGLFLIINYIAPTLLKLTYRLKLLVAINFFGTGTILFLSWLFIKHGLSGIGLAWFYGQLVTSILYLVFLLPSTVIKSLDQNKYHDRIAHMKKIVLLSFIKQYFLLLRRELSLLAKSPREYIYSYTFPTNKTIKIEKYNPRVTKLGESFIKKLRAKHPELKIYFVGSAVLKIAGQKDIDLFVVSKPKNFHIYLPTLCTLFGEPMKKRKNFIEWHLEKNGCSIEVLLIDPLNNIFRGPLKTFTILKNNQRLRREYERIKLKSNGVSVREYKKRRLEFFNRIMAQAA